MPQPMRRTGAKVVKRAGMKLGEIDFPEELLNAVRKRKLVIFAGAGVSMDEPADLPGFGEFAKLISRGSGETKTAKETEDQFLGRLQHKKQKVHIRAARILSRKGPRPTSLHFDLLKIFSGASQVRLVTTNFDTLFEQAAEGVLDSTVRVYSAPALPQGSDFEGIVHVHGSTCEPNRMVLTDADFGKAYIVDGWASRFLSELFESFTVLFVGYSYNDIVMKYLARSLTPIGQAKRFILIKEGGEESWAELGISPIEFRISKEDRYRVLYEGINCLAAYANRSHAVWQAKIIEIAGNPPPSCCQHEENETIAEALSDLWRTRIFCKGALNPDWIEWLDDKQYLDKLFDPSGEPLSSVDLRLSYWLSETFALEYADELFLLISRHQMELHPDLWSAIGGTFAEVSVEEVNPEILSRWVSLLLEYSHSDQRGPVLLQLGLKCAESRQFHSLVEIFDAMSEPRLVIGQGIETPLYKSSFRVWADTNLRFDLHSLWTLWERGLKPNLPEVVDSVLVSTVANLSTMYRTFRSWHPEDFEDDYVSSSRLDLESGTSEPVDVLIDATRDCLAHLSACRPESAAEWCNRLIDCGVPILRRLSLRAFTSLEHCGLTVDVKLEWLLHKVGIYDLAAEGEVVASLQILYPQSSEGVRQSLIGSVLNHKEIWTDSSLEENERQKARLHLRWLRVLEAADSTCPLVQDALRDIQETYPELRESRHLWAADRFFRSAPMSIPNLWTVDELFEQSEDRLANELPLRFEQEESGIVRDRILQNVREAARTSPGWGYRVAESLVASSNWDTQLWVPLLESWSREVNESLHADVLRLLFNEEVGQNHPNSVAKMLLALVSSDRLPYAFSLLSDANQVAELLWSSATDAEVIPGTSEEDWLSETLEHPAGALTRFWVQSLSLWYDQQDPKPCSLPREYLTPLSTIVEDNTLAGQVGLMALTEGVQQLMDVDQGWCLDNLIPVLWQPKSHKYRFAWHGLTPINFSTCVADKLQDAFLYAAFNLNELFPVNAESPFQPNSHMRNNFIRSYLELMNLIADDPVISWIPRLLNSFKIEEDRHYFALCVRNRLIEMNDEDQCTLWEDWLGEYWENRLDNVPYGLTKCEVQGMLNWMPYFKSKFPEAIGYATRMPRHDTDPNDMLGYICEKKLWKDYPEATVNLLTYLAQSESLAWSMHRVRQLMTDLAALGMSDSQNAELDKLAILLGMELGDSETNT